MTQPATENIYRLVYYSHNRIAGTPEHVAAEVEKILAASRRNNPAVNVTGALMFNAGGFAQVLEGPRDSVERVFEVIQRDSRHGDVHMLSFAPASGRAFARWSMAYVGTSTADSARFGDIAGTSGFDPKRVTGDALFETLHRLVLEEETDNPER